MSEQKEYQLPGFVLPWGYDRATGLESVGPGWAELVNEAFDAAERFGVKIVQVKEKFGELRVYFGSYPDRIRELEMDLLLRSGHICETCGRSGSRTTDNRWILTLCDACKERAGRV